MQYSRATTLYWSELRIVQDYVIDLGGTIRLY